jgi:adenine phosphoribosyltransferase
MHDSVPSAESALHELENIYRAASVIEFNGQLITINAFTDQCEPLAPHVLSGIADLIEQRLQSIDYDIIIGEEDKGAHIATAVSLRTAKPLILARWYVYPIEEVHPSATVVQVDSEYYKGSLILNGLPTGARVVIIEDTVSTGGTVIALVNCIKARGAHVARIVAVVEKVDNGGVPRILTATGVPVQTLMQIRVRRDRVEVLPAV